MRIRSRHLLPIAAAGVLCALGCGGATFGSKRYSPDQASVALRQLESTKLDLGLFPMDGSSGVLDGDTVMVKGLDSSLRLLGLDTEETFKKEDERRAYGQGWDAYKRQMRGSSKRPVKYATPLGDEAKKFAQKFFDGVNQVRLERDHPAEIRDVFSRYLAYIFVEKAPGQWLNYNVECVRAGMSPYFTKYGRSRRFHEQFLEAQSQAMTAKRGVWDPSKESYGDYPERLAWWGKREAAQFVFEKRMAENENFIVLSRTDALIKLEQHVDREVVLLGSVVQVRLGDRGPTIVKLGRSARQTFDVVFFDKDAALVSGITRARGELVQVRGVVKRYADKHRNTQRLQVVVELPSNVLIPVPPEEDEDIKTDVEVAGD